MADEKKLQKKRREAASKLCKPKPVELSSGKWRCQIMIDGERISVVDDDPEVAHAKILSMKVGIVDYHAQEDSEKKGNITLGKAIDKYIQERDNILSPSTINGYKEIKRNRLQGLMKKSVYKITTSDIQAEINIDAKTVSAKTIKNAVGLVIAVISEYKEINTKRIKLPQRKKKEHAFLDEQGMIELFDAIQGSPVEIPILLAVWLGMRRSEIMGLCWDSIDFESSKIKVQRTYVKDKENGYVLRNEMKTEASRRTLDCPGYILAKLSQYTPGRREGRVFTMHPNTIYKEMKKICNSRNICFVGVHGLRHTNASVMMSLGIIDRVAMARNGWSTDVTMKQVYQHVFQSDKVSAGDKMDTYFQSIASGVNPKITHEITHGEKKNQ